MFKKKNDKKLSLASSAASPAIPSPNTSAAPSPAMRTALASPSTSVAGSMFTPLATAKSDESLALNESLRIKINKLPDLHRAAYKGKLDKFTSLLTKKNSLTQLQTSESQAKLTPLHCAILSHQVEVIKLILQKMKVGGSLDAKDQDANTPLIMAAARNHWDIVSLLLQETVDVNAKNVLNMTTLHYAITHGNIEIVESILAKHPDLSVGGEMAYLSYAILNKQFDIAEVLLGHPLNVDAMDDDGRTCLHHAVQADDIELVKSILATKVDITIVDTFGGAAIDYAESDDIHAEIEKAVIALEAKSAIKKKDFLSSADTDKDKTPLKPTPVEQTIDQAEEIIQKPATNATPAKPVTPAVHKLDDFGLSPEDLVEEEDSESEHSHQSLDFDDVSGLPSESAKPSAVTKSPSATSKTSVSVPTISTASPPAHDANISTPLEQWDSAKEKTAVAKIAEQSLPEPKAKAIDESNTSIKPLPQPLSRVSLGPLRPIGAALPALKPLGTSNGLLPLSRPPVLGGPLAPLSDVRKQESKPVDTSEASSASSPAPISEAAVSIEDEIESSIQGDEQNSVQSSDSPKLSRSSSHAASVKTDTESKKVNFVDPSARPKSASRTREVSAQPEQVSMKRTASFLNDATDTTNDSALSKAEETIRELKLVVKSNTEKNIQLHNDLKALEEEKAFVIKVKEDELDRCHEIIEELRVRLESQEAAHQSKNERLQLKLDEQIASRKATESKLTHFTETQNNVEAHNAETRKLETRITDLQQELEKVRKAEAESAATAKDLNDQMIALKQQNAQSEEELLDQMSRIVQSSAEIDDKHSENDILSASLTQEKDAHQQTKQQLNKLRSELDAANTSRSIALQDVKQLSSNLEVEKRERASLAALLEQYKVTAKQSNSSDAVMAEQQVTIETLRLALEVASKSNDQESSSLIAVKDACKRHLTELHEAKLQNSLLTQELAGLKTQEQNAEHHVQALISQHSADIERAIKSSTARLTQMHSFALTQKQNELDAITEALKASHDRENTSYERIRTGQHAITSHEEVVRSLQDEIKRIQGLHEKQMRSHKDDLDSREAQQKEQRAQYTTLMSQINNANILNEKQIMENTALKKLYDGLLERTEAHSRRDNAQLDLLESRYKDQIIALQNRLDQSHSVAGKSEASVNEVLARLKNMELQLERSVESRYKAELETVRKSSELEYLQRDLQAEKSRYKRLSTKYQQFSRDIIEQNSHRDVLEDVWKRSQHRFGGGVEQIIDASSLSDLTRTQSKLVKELSEL